MKKITTSSKANELKKFTLSPYIFLALFTDCTTKQQDATPKTNRLIGDGFGIQSATLIVKNLDSTRNYFTDVLGFSMTPPKRYAKGIYDGTQMASVSFADFTTFDILSTIDSVAKAGKQASFLKQNKIAGLYSFSTSSVDTTTNWLHSQGFKTGSVKTGRSAKEIAKGWDWDDGGPQWRSVEFNHKNTQSYLPNFLEYTGLPYKEIQDEWKPAAWRKYYEKNPNGAFGISSVRIVVADLKTASDEFEKMGLTALESNDSFTRFIIAHNQELYVTAPKSPDDEFSKILKTQGSGVYSICFGIKNLKETKEFLKKKLSANAMVVDTIQKRLTVLKKYAFGVQLEFAEESKEEAMLAKIYDFNDSTKMNSSSVRYASNLYTKYCALCHGKDRQGYAADNAPSLRSHTLLATTIEPRASYNFLAHTVEYGRSGTAMGPYAKNQGGPLDGADIELLLRWLREAAGVKKPVKLDLEPVIGNADLGKTLYTKHCASCHGTKGEGISAPALANPMLLATASDAFLRYTITEGRAGTPMVSFKDSLSKNEINAVTAYLRSRASGWNAPAPVTVTEPKPANYVLNPKNKAPKFTLKEDKYVSAKQLIKALKDSTRMIILDARSKAAWQQTHIPGAVSVPYYEEPDKFIKNIPNDNTLIVAYCACPHAASTGVVNTLKRFGYKHTAILDEGILVWAQMGYPVQYGKVNKKKSKGKYLKK
jgi:mono/diheme cytochrome c family protein/rhodanese-related sulfurtransferase